MNGPCLLSAVRADGVPRHWDSAGGVPRHWDSSCPANSPAPFTLGLVLHDCRSQTAQGPAFGVSQSEMQEEAEGHSQTYCGLVFSIS